jgi:type II secretory pathway pseudopilin PulG
MKKPSPPTYPVLRTSFLSAGLFEKISARGNDTIGVIMFSPNKQAGQSLVMTLVSVAIMGILVMTMLTVLQNQNREARALNEKLAAADLEKTLIAALNDGSVCKYLLTAPGSGSTSVTFNPRGLNGQNPIPVIVPIPNPPAGGAALYASINQTIPPTAGAIVAQVGKAPSAYSNTLVVKSIELSINACSGTTGTIGCAANWMVDFDPTKLIRPIKSGAISTTLTANVSGATATISGCQSSGRGGQLASVSVATCVPSIMTVPTVTGATWIMIWAACQNENGNATTGLHANFLDSSGNVLYSNPACNSTLGGGTAGEVVRTYIPVMIPISSQTAQIQFVPTNSTCGGSTDGVYIDSYAFY